MRDFVGHDAGEFGFFLGAQNEAAVDVKEATGKSESVHFVGVDDLDSEGNFCVGVADEILAYAVDVFSDDGIIDELGGTLDFLGELLAEADFALERIEIGSFAYVAVADGVNVILRVLGVHRVLLRNRLILRSLRLRGWRGRGRGLRLRLAGILAWLRCWCRRLLRLRRSWGLTRLLGPGNRQCCARGEETCHRKAQGHSGNLYHGIYLPLRSVYTHFAILGCNGFRALNHYDVRPMQKVSYSLGSKWDFAGSDEARWSKGAAGSAAFEYQIEQRPIWCQKCSVRRVDTFSEGL